jgi:ketopantoate reductase
VELADALQAQGVDVHSVKVPPPGQHPHLGQILTSLRMFLTFSSLALLLSAMRELVAVARARGVAVPDAAIDRALAIVDAMPKDGTASMQRDLAAGRPSELDDQAGALVRMAREAGVLAPVHEALHAALLPLERVARGTLPPFQRT